MRRRGPVLILLAFAMVAGCGFAGIGRPGEGAYPEACAAWGFPDRQCKAIVSRAQEQAGVDGSRIASIRFLPFEPEVTLGGGRIALVAFDLEDGTTVHQDVRCVGVGGGPVCQADPQILTGAGLDRDVPCAGEPPAGCATVPPTPPPAAVALGVPLEVDRFQIPIDRLGRYRVKVGEATLPDGHLSERSFSLGDPAPDDYWLDHIALVVESDIPGRGPAGSIYREPFQGPEPMTVFAVFEVTELFEPSVVELRDIVVR